MTNTPQPQDYSILVYFSAEDEGYVATSPEFPGLTAVGATHAEAQTELYEVLEGAIEIYLEDGYPLPAPVIHTAQELPSGAFRLRLPRTIHKRLSNRAALEGVSQNQLAATYIAAGLERSELTEGLNESIKQHEPS